MILPARILIIIVAIVFIAYIILLVSKRRLLLKYSLLWLTLSVVLCLCAAFPTPVYVLAQFLGFEVASNFIFVIAIFFLLAISLSLSIIASKQTERSKTLIQELAILKQQVEKNSSSTQSDEVAGKDKKLDQITEQNE